MKTFNIADIADKHILGRTCFDGKSLVLLWGASGVEFNVNAKEIWVQFSSSFDTHEPWVSVEMNGYETNRFIAPLEKTWVCIGRNLNPESINRISIIKDTQAMAGDNSHALYIHAVRLDDDGEFMEIKPRSKKIEFVGDSITSGEGLAGIPSEMDWISQCFRSSKTYAVQTAKMLDADWSCVSQSGWGICWGWDACLTSKVPAHYSQVCSLLSGEVHKKLGSEKSYDFNQGSDYVVINLGTNDNTGLKVEGFSGTADDVYTGVKDFLKLIRQKNPSASILWVWGMIALDVLPSVICKAVDDYKKESGDSKVYALELDAMEKVEVNEEDKGSRGHPGPKTHKLAAQKISEFLRKL